MQSTSWETLDWKKQTQAGIKIAGRNINNLRYADDTTLMAESEVELKILLMKVKAQHSENEDHGTWSHHFMGNRWGKRGNRGNSGWLYFSELQNHCRWWLQPWSWKTLAPWKESYDQPIGHIKKQRHYFVNKGLSDQGSYGFSSDYVWMWELDCEESWVLKNLMLLSCAVGEDSWESLGLQGDTTSPFWRTPLGFLWKEWC